MILSSLVLIVGVSLNPISVGAVESKDSDITQYYTFNQEEEERLTNEINSQRKSRSTSGYSKARIINSNLVTTPSGEANYFILSISKDFKWSKNANFSSSSKLSFNLRVSIQGVSARFTGTKTVQTALKSIDGNPARPALTGQVRRYSYVVDTYNGAGMKISTSGIKCNTVICAEQVELIYADSYTGRIYRYVNNNKVKKNAYYISRWSDYSNYSKYTTITPKQSDYK